LLLSACQLDAGRRAVGQVCSVVRSTVQGPKKIDVRDPYLLEPLSQRLYCERAAL
jgi:hypothetical protein